MMTLDYERLLESIHENISAVDYHDWKLSSHHNLLMNQGFSGDDFVEDVQTADTEPPGEAEEDRRTFWESREFLLQEILDQHNSTTSKLREQIKKHINIARNSNYCNCLDINLGAGCIKCLCQALVDQLCSKGFSAVICTSKWNRTQTIPGGTHEYIEVIGSTQGRKKQIRFLVELGFCNEFRMAKACEEYNKLINQLPEIYIGKGEHLNAIIRVVCEAAKKSSEEQQIHMGPWRKKSFMQMKWSASSEKRFL